MGLATHRRSQSSQPLDAEVYDTLMCRKTRVGHSDRHAFSHARALIDILSNYVIVVYRIDAKGGNFGTKKDEPNQV